MEGNAVILMKIVRTGNGLLKMKVAFHTPSERNNNSGSRPHYF